MNKLDVYLLPDRSTHGKAVYHHPSGDWEFPILGKADNARARATGNPTRDPTKLYGDTPTGAYLAKFGARASPIATYGPHPVFILDPQSGEAKEAKDNGRAGLWGHGGNTAYNGLLRPTYGCLRTYNHDQEKLWQLQGSEEFLVEVQVVPVLP
jgi:hypothetical protein